MAETRLVAVLEQYAGQLETHLSALNDRHTQLQLAWGRLREIYEGEGAQVFAEAFESASARLKEYSERGAQIRHELQAKIEDLRRFQAGGSDL
jgi:uncharacterized protein YukE